MKWEPIETAPKDCALLLCLNGKSVAIGNWKKTLDGEMWVSEEYAETIRLWLEPTHWMHLPELPSKAAFEKVSCSQCGRDFGPGEHGFSHCSDHAR